MARSFSVEFLKFSFPPAEPPAWSASVERWYQLDAPSFGFCELWSKKDQSGMPDLMLLASPGGSMEMDVQFVATGASNPAKFVHTLPSVRAAALMRCMEWHGPLLCLQNDPFTVSNALAETARWLEREQKRVWILGYLAPYVFRIRMGEHGPFVVEEGTLTPPEDSELLAWLRSPSPSQMGLDSKRTVRFRGPP